MAPVSTNPPRAVFVTRESDYELLLARHATREQARFFLDTRGQSIDALADRHQRFSTALQSVRAAVPSSWRQASVSRRDLDRFLFGPEDIVIAVGQDGLIANIAKYLHQQPVIGVNPDASQYDGVLARFSADAVPDLLPAVAAGDCMTEHLTMAQAVLDNGTRLLALNEFFVGHRSHQSARYEIGIGDRHEAQSSSGVIVATGTGTTGWARSIMESVGTQMPLARDERAVNYFVREPFPSVATATTIRMGRVDASDHIAITSRLNDGGIIFADGIEQHFLEFDWGRRVQIEVAPDVVNLITGG